MNPPYSSKFSFYPKKQYHRCGKQKPGKDEYSHPNQNPLNADPVNIRHLLSLSQRDFTDLIFYPPVAGQEGTDHQH
jgi:hypothetical protein